MGKFFKHPTRPDRAHFSSARRSFSSSRQRGTPLSLSKLFNKNKPHSQQTAEYHLKMMEKSPEIPSDNWPDVSFVFPPRGESSILKMSAKPGIPLYKENIENYLNRNVVEVFDGKLGHVILALGKKAWTKNKLLVQGFEIAKGGRTFWKEFWFYPLRDMIIVCTQHISVVDDRQSFFDPKVN